MDFHFLIARLDILMSDKEQLLIFFGFRLSLEEKKI